jgi:hypothetical protein
MTQYYPVRRYSSTAEPRRGDIVRMRHDAELHGDISPAFDDCIVASIDAEMATLTRPHVSLRAGEVRQHLEIFYVETARLVECFYVLTTGPRGAVDNRVSEQQWAVRFVHKISQHESDDRLPVTLPLGAFNDKRAAGIALRAAGLLPAGSRIKELRHESDHIIAFLAASVWHAIILTFIEEPKREPAPVFSTPDSTSTAAQ